MNTLILFIVIILCCFILYALFFTILPLLFGASYEKTNDEVAKKMIQFSKIKKGEKMADLGSGDGALVIAFAKKGAEAHGYEINPFLVLYSKRRIKQLHLEKKGFIHWKNFWKVNLAQFDIITIFQISYLMPLLEKKLRKEKKPKRRVLTNHWKINNQTPLKESKVGTGIYLYKI